VEQERIALKAQRCRGLNRLEEPKAPSKRPLAHRAKANSEVLWSYRRGRASPACGVSRARRSDARDSARHPFYAGLSEGLILQI